MTLSQNFLITWSILPFSSHGGLPSVAEIPWNSVWNKSVSDMVYFSETTKSQLEPDGSGFGTFETDILPPSLEDLNISSSVIALQEDSSPGSVIR
jgi:hypothetical protein